MIWYEMTRQSVHYGINVPDSDPQSHVREDQQSHEKDKKDSRRRKQERYLSCRVISRWNNSWMVETWRNSSQWEQRGGTHKRRRSWGVDLDGSTEMVTMGC